MATIRDVVPGPGRVSPWSDHVAVTASSHASGHESAGRCMVESLLDTAPHSRASERELSRKTTPCPPPKRLPTSA